MTQLLKSARAGFGRLAPVILMVALTPLGAWSQAAPPAGGSGVELDERIRSRIERNGTTAPVIVVADERIHASSVLPRFYEARGFRAAWTGGAGPLPVADSLVRVVAGAEREGLRPEDYHLPRIEALLEEVREAWRGGGSPSPDRLADLDLLLTDAFLLYGSHLLSGRVDPVTMHPEWNARGRAADLVETLDSALSTSAVATVLETLLPEHPEYFLLRSALERYRGIVRGGGLPEVPGRQLRAGSTDAAVPVVRRWTRLTGDLAVDAPAPADSMYFDAALEEAVRRMQRRHALAPTGVVTLETSGLMNVPLERRVRELELSLERWRWLPRDLGERHVRVNIAGLDVRVLEGDSVAFESRTMVGQRYRKTPVFSDRITYLVLNPTWTIPPGILEADKLPLIRRDAGYLRANRIRVLDPAGREVDPSGIDWSRVSGNTAYRLRMDPGPENPLGQVKFMFPNAYSIYLHDTPSRELFDRSRRDFSSGCIRVERPMELAEYLLRDDPRWTRERMDAALRGSGEQTVPLSRPVPVHILYWTAWAERDGAVHFREDIYDRDDALAEALREPPPAAPSANPAGGR